MAQKKNTDQVEVVKNETAKNAGGDGQIADGIYTEREVELLNGVKVDIEVIVDRDMLPASVSSLAHEGNIEGMLMAQLTAKTRKLLDWTGATRKDLHEVIAPVVQRGTELADK